MTTQTPTIDDEGIMTGDRPVPIVNPTPVVVTPVAEVEHKTPLSTYLGYTALVLFIIFLIAFCTHQ